jgi:hypothetical protein
LYSFLVGGILSLLWCFIVLIVPMRIHAPNTSVFPEMDIASKLPDASHGMGGNSVAQLLAPLSNAESLEIRHRLAYRRFQVQNSNDYDGKSRAVFALHDQPKKLKPEMLTDSGYYRAEWVDIPAIIDEYQETKDGRLMGQRERTWL